MGYRIRKPESNEFGSLRAYFTEGDPLVQYNHYEDPSIDDLAQKLKVLALLNNSITVAGSHVLESNVTYSLLKKHPEFLQRGIVIPAINEDFDSFQDMVNRKLNSPTYSKPASPIESLDEDTLRTRAEFLETHTTEVMGWSIDEMRGDFKDSLYYALTTPESALYETVADTTDPESLKTQIEANEIISRNTIQKELQGLPSRIQQTVMDYVNANYHLVGATTHRAVPNVHQQELPLFKQLFEGGVTIDEQAIGDSPAALPNQSQPIEEASLFNEYLEAMNTDISTVQLLDSGKVLDLRDESITTDFRKKLYEVLQEVRTGADPDIKYEFDELQTEFREELDKEVENEERRTQQMERTSMRIKTAVHAANIGALKISPELSTALTIANPVLTKLADKLPDLIGNEFMTFNQEYNSVVVSDSSP